jgi:serine protease Do
MHGQRWFHLVAVMSVALAACGGDDDTSSTTTPTTEAPVATTAPPPAETTPTTAPAEGGAITSIEDVGGAVVQVLAEGSFRDPVEGTQGFAGSGSGFVIDPDGIVVTNNHVVTGAGAVKVVLDDEEIPAQVLGVSECNDLAVLQLVDPGPYPYLEWFEDEISPPLEVYTAGFPLGDPEFTITRGIVSKAEADGRTQWASVRHVIEHDAAIQPGNSGGPLVANDGRVVGVNYASGDPGTGTNQFFAIAADLAAPVVERLRGGDDETIGVNGQAVGSEDGSVAGVWVAGIEAGSPAADAGVLPGDVITTLNGVTMSPVTMEPYCDVLRSAVPGDPIAIQVLRFDTGEVWEGELNGRPMTARFSFADELADEVPADDSGGEPAPGYTYETVVDDTGTLVVSVPVEWAQRDFTPTDLGLEGGPVPSIAAAPDLASFYETYTSPGLLMLGLASGGSALGTDDELLDLMAPDDPACVDEGRDAYSDPVFTGRVGAWTCGGAALYVVVSAAPIEAPDARILVAVIAVTDADLAALDEIIYTFNFA